VKVRRGELVIFRNPPPYRIGKIREWADQKNGEEENNPRGKVGRGRVTRGPLPACLYVNHRALMKTQDQQGGKREV